MVYERYFYRATEELSLGPTDFLPDPERPLLFEEAPIGLLSWKRLAEPCVVVLGDSGLGKTTFLKRQCQAQPDGLWLDLGEARMVQEHKTVKSWIQGEPYLLTLFLDGLDEWPSAKGNVTKLLERDLRDLPADRLRLRLSCRPHDWLRSLQELLELLWPAQVGIYSMAPLRGRDVADRVRHEGLDPDAFGRELERTGLHPLATRPLTLEFLLDGFRRQGQMASTPGELFQGGCRRLAQRGPAGDLEAPRRLAVAGRIAAMCELGGYRLVQLDKDPGDSTVLAYGEIALGQESSRQQEFDVTESLVQQTLQTALFHNGRWSHKSYAEFLAAEYLERRLTVEQVTDLLLEPVTGLVYPQLREVAAWFASSSRGFFERLAAQQPDVLLIGLAGLPQEWQRRSLLEKLCHWLDHNPVANPWRLRGYEKFYPRKSGEKARLAEQLRPLLLFPTSSARSRVAAVVTAIKCGIDDLQADLVTLAVGPATPLEVKDLAAWGVVELGNDASRRQLKVLLDDLSGDHQDELKGLVLQALWPDSLTFEELLPLLTPPRQPELFGAYRSFLTDHLAQKCKDEDISRALRWVVRAPGWDALSSFEDLTDGLVTKGLERFERPEVADALTDAVLTLLRSERSYWLTNCERFCDELGRSPGLRRDLVGRLVNRLAPEGQVKLLDRTNAFSFSEEDSRWILQEIERAPDATRKAWGELLGSPRLPPSESVLPDMRRLAERFPELKDTWVRHLAPPPPPHEAGPTRRVLVAQVRGILQKQPSAEVGWPVVVSLLLRGRECLLSAFLHPAASNQSLWDLLDPDERGQILDMAQHYLAKAEPHTASWWLSPRLDPTVPSAWAALDLLRKERTDVFSSLPPAVWSRWAAAILHHPLARIDTERESGQILVSQGCTQAPLEFCQRLGELFAARAAEAAGDLWRLETCPRGPLDATLLEILRTLHGRPFGAVARFLLARACEEAADVCSERLQGATGAEPEERHTAVLAAAALVTSRHRSVWAHVRALGANHPDWWLELLSELAGPTSGERYGWLQELSAQELQDLYRFLYATFPPDQDPSPVGARQVSLREKLAAFRETVLNALAQLGTPEAADAMDEIARSHPEHLWKAHEARLLTVGKAWTPVTPAQLLALAENSARGPASSPQQLLDRVVASLGRFQATWLPANVGFLWDGEAPKAENWLSQAIRNHLDKDLKETLVNREVEVVPRDCGVGERVDLQVEGLSPAGQRLKLIVEVKRCDHVDVWEALRHQLVDRYLKAEGLSTGLYVVGWFDCDRWWQSKCLDRKRLTREQAQEELDRQAQELAQEGYTIRVVVLDTSHPTTGKNATA